MKRIISCAINSVRWVLVLPFACLAMYISYGIIWFALVGLTSLRFFSYISEFIANQAAGFVFIYAGTYVAPCYKKVSAIILGVLFLLYSIYTVVDPFHLYTDSSLLETIVYKIGGLLACIGAIVLIRESD